MVWSSFTGIKCSLNAFFNNIKKSTCLQVCLRNLEGKNIAAPYDMEIEVVVLQPQSADLVNKGKDVSIGPEGISMGGFADPKQDNGATVWKEEDFDKYIERTVPDINGCAPCEAILHNTTNLKKGT